VVLDGTRAGRRFELAEGARLVAGRGERCEIQLTDGEASREHAVFRRDRAGVHVADAGAKNGVRVDGERVDGERRLRDGEVVTLGATRLAFEDPAAAYLRRLDALAEAAAPGRTRRRQPRARLRRARARPPSPEPPSPRLATAGPRPPAASARRRPASRPPGLPRAPAADLRSSVTPPAAARPGGAWLLLALAAGSPCARPPWRRWSSLSVEPRPGPR